MSLVPGTIAYEQRARAYLRGRRDGEAGLEPLSWLAWADAEEYARGWAEGQRCRLVREWN